jgi:uncharacterized protein YbcI
MAREIANAAITFERQRAGRSPESVTVMLGDGTLLIAVRGALSLAEQALASTPDGAARVEELQRKVFQAAGGALRQDIERITGAPIRAATARTDVATGSVVQAFPGGTLVQIYVLGGKLPVQYWSGSDPAAPDSEDAVS